MKYERFATAGVLLCATSAALAVPVTVIGSTFDITYDSALVGRFGLPTLSGSSVGWFPSGSPGFTAQTGAGFNVTNSTFALTVTAHPGYQLGSFSLTEAGDYFFFASGATVSVSGQLRVTPLPGNATSTAAIALASPAVANAFLDFSTTNWSSTAAAIALSTGTTKANVSVQNILSAYVPSGTDGYAFIEKTDAFLSVDMMQLQAPVPEPKTVATMLAGLGVVGLVALRRRRRH